VTLLLDTHVFLWWRLNSARLKPPVRRVIASSDRVLVSVVSAWEAALKRGLGRLEIAEDKTGRVRLEPLSPPALKLQDLVENGAEGAVVEVVGSWLECPHGPDLRGPAHGRT